MKPYLTANSILSNILRVKSCASPKNLPLIVWTWPGLCTGALPLNPTKPNCGSMLWCSLKCLSRFLTKSGNRDTTDCIPCPSLLTKTTSTFCVEFSCHEEFFSTKTPSILQDAGEGNREIDHKNAIGCLNATYFGMTEFEGGSCLRSMQ